MAVRDWSIAEVAAFLRSEGLDAVASQAEAEEVDGEAFVLLQTVDIQELGMKKGPALKLRQKIRQMSGLSTPSSRQMSGLSTPTSSSAAGATAAAPTGEQRRPILGLPEASATLGVGAAAVSSRVASLAAPAAAAPAPDLALVQALAAAGQGAAADGEGALSAVVAAPAVVAVASSRAASEWETASSGEAVAPLELVPVDEVATEDEVLDAVRDKTLDVLPDDERSWAIVQKSFGHIQQFLADNGLEDHYENLLSNGVMTAQAFVAVSSARAKLKEYGVVDPADRQLIRTKAVDILKDPEARLFEQLYGDVAQHIYTSDQGKRFIGSRMDWPVFKWVKDSMPQQAATRTNDIKYVPDEHMAIFSTEGLWATATSCDGLIFLWPTDRPGEACPPCARCVQAHFDICTDHVTDWSSMRAISVGGDQNLVLSDLDSGRILAKVRSDSGNTIGHMFICVDGDVSVAKAAVGCASQGAQVKIADLEAKKFLLSLPGHWDDVHDIKADWDLNRVVSSSWDRLINVYDLRAGKCVTTLSGHSGAINKIDVDFDLQLALSCADEDRLILWDLRQGRVLRAYDAPAAKDIAVDWRGMRAASCGEAAQIDIWDLETGELTKTVDATDCILPQTLDVDWDQGQALLGTWDNQVLLFDLASGDCIKKLRKPGRTLTRVRLKRRSCLAE